MTGTSGDTGTSAGLVVVGGGAAGLAAAATARAAGVGVTLVADGPLGGDCTWHGCVPTKSLLAAAAAGADTAEALAHARSVVARAARGESEAALRRAGTRVLRGRAVLRPATGGRPAVQVTGGDDLRAEVGVLLATGSRPLPAPASLSEEDLPPGCVVVDTDGWLEAVEAHAAARPGGPVVVLGGGASGVELAQGLARLQRTGPTGPPGPTGRGADDGPGLDPGVVLLERAPELLPDLPGAGSVVAAALRADGVDVRTGTTGPQLRHLLRPGSLVLLTTGRAAVLDVLGPGCGVETADGAVLVDRSMRTSAERVVAAGDVTGLRPSTHLAVAGARVAVGSLLGHDVGLDPTWSPRVVWSDPQVAVVGTVPAEPVAAPTRSVRVPLSRNDRSLTAAVPGRTDRSRGGFVRVWTAPGPDGSWVGGGRVVGAMVVGPDAGELLGEVAMAGRLGLDVESWLGGRVGLGALAGQHPYPGWSWVWDAVADRLLVRAAVEPARSRGSARD